ncbi:MAG TPA: rhomboid family intramembrane serine protease [Candidatus Thermoplasmatota archaeon]|nr:rhomboid family intramembrane serine protease [Candidatus Thermoplasmatota archaeon]
MFEGQQPAYGVAGPSRWQPRATYGLLAAIVAVYVAELVALSRSEALFTRIFVIDTDWPHRPWSLLTSTLSHGSIGHLFLNGLFLYFFGPVVERIIGRGPRGTLRFVGLFLATGALSGIAQVHLEAAFGGTGGALGASGALMALFGVVWVLLPREKVLFWGIAPMPMWGVGLLYVLLDILGAANTEDRVGNFAHLAGLGFGAAYGAWARYDLRRRGLRLVRS